MGKELPYQRRARIEEEECEQLRAQNAKLREAAANALECIESSTKKKAEYVAAVAMQLRDALTESKP